MHFYFCHLNTPHMLLSLLSPSNCLQVCWCSFWKKNVGCLKIQYFNSQVSLSSSCAMPFIARTSLGTVTTSGGWGLCPELETVSVWLWGCWLWCHALLKCSLGSVLWLRCEGVLSSGIPFLFQKCKLRQKEKPNAKGNMAKESSRKKRGMGMCI